jgi:hypothetical protein
VSCVCLRLTFSFTNKILAAISSHACYFAHPDIAYFLVRLLHRLDENGNGTTNAAEAAAEAGVMRV